ncbi:MAG: peptide-methionine (R)-S-oxide reductase [Parvularculaceae bacterium]|nr:peptide-methionine (R)-S-oxide reductase [Parvularculaceae bacterium]
MRSGTLRTRQARRAEEKRSSQLIAPCAKTFPSASQGDSRHFLIVPRTKQHCARCDGRQGHAFDDGPPPTSLRNCNNGVVRV